MNKVDEYYKLDELSEIVRLSTPRLNGKPMKLNEIEGIKWILKYYKDMLPRISGSELVLFQFHGGNSNELVIVEHENKVQKMLWLSGNPLHVVASLNNKTSLKVDIRSKDLHNSEDKVEVYPINNNTLCFLDKDKDINILNYDNIRYDRRDLIGDFKTASELFYVLKQVNNKENKNEQDDYNNNLELSPEEEFKRQVELSWNTSIEEFTEGDKQKR